MISVLRDAGNVISGFFAILWYSISKDKIKLSLSLFTTTSPVVRQGRHCPYNISICNVSEQNAWVRLIIDIYLKENPVHPEGHYGCFEKAIFMRAHQSLSLRIIYDWDEYASIYIDDVSFEPDVFWSGDCQFKGKYLVKALLLDKTGEAFSELSLVQNLSE